MSFVFVGFYAPVEQNSEVSKEFNCSKQELWNNITNVNLYPEIKEEVADIEILDEQGKTWREFSKAGNVTDYEIIEEVPGEKLVVKIIDQTLDLVKMRVYNIYGGESSSVLSVKENTRVEKILLRSTLAISGSNHFVEKEINNLHSYLNLE